MANTSQTTSSAPDAPEDRDRKSLRDRVRGLYSGRTRQARYFRYGLLIFDVVSVIFFIATSITPDETWVLVVDAVIAVLIFADLAARFWIEDRRADMLTQVGTWIDVAVIISLLLPFLISNFLFLRVVRSLRLLRSYRVLADLREEFDFFRRHEAIIQSAINLGVFVFIMTALVYILQARTNPQIENYVDALYFTVTTLTTTGYGDITLTGMTGKILSVIIMIFGVALFLRLIQTVFRPNQVRFACPDCGLQRHEADAVHCKHCGRVLNIANEGRDA